MGGRTALGGIGQSQRRRWRGATESSLLRHGDSLAVPRRRRRRVEAVPPSRFGSVPSSPGPPLGRDDMLAAGAAGQCAIASFPSSFFFSSSFFFLFSSSSSRLAEGVEVAGFFPLALLTRAFPPANGARESTPFRDQQPLGRVKPHRRRLSFRRLDLPGRADRRRRRGAPPQRRPAGRPGGRLRALRGRAIRQIRLEPTASEPRADSPTLSSAGHPRSAKRGTNAFSTWIERRADFSTFLEKSAFGVRVRGHVLRTN